MPERRPPAQTAGRPDRKGPRSAVGRARTECRGPHGRNSASVTANLGTAHELEEFGLCHRTPRGQRSGFLEPPRPAATEPTVPCSRGSVGNAHPQPSRRPSVTSGLLLRRCRVRDAVGDLLGAFTSPSSSMRAAPSSKLKLGKGVILELRRK